jgi:hypothetical protein
MPVIPAYSSHTHFQLHGGETNLRTNLHHIEPSSWLQTSQAPVCAVCPKSAFCSDHFEVGIACGGHQAQRRLQANVLSSQTWSENGSN